MIFSTTENVSSDPSSKPVPVVFVIVVVAVVFKGAAYSPVPGQRYYVCRPYIHYPEKVVLLQWTPQVGNSVYKGTDFRFYYLS